MPARAAATLAVVFLAVALVAIGLGLLPFRLLVAARWIYRWQVRLIMRCCQLDTLRSARPGLLKSGRALIRLANRVR
jgi:hypothetical protein